MKFNINDKVVVVSNMHQYSMKKSWFADHDIENLAQFYDIKNWFPTPGKHYIVRAVVHETRGTDATFYVITGSMRSNTHAYIVDEHAIELLNAVENTNEKKETKTMNKKSENSIKSAISRQNFANAVKLITEAAIKAGSDNAHELTLEQIVQRVNDHVDIGDVVRIVNPVKAITDGDSYFTAALEKMVRYYPYMIFPRKYIKGEVVEIIVGEIETIFAIKDYKNRIWLMNRDGIEIANEV